MSAAVAFAPTKGCAFAPSIVKFNGSIMYLRLGGLPITAQVPCAQQGR